MTNLLEITPGGDEVVDYADWAEIATLFKADANVSEEDLAREIHRSGLATEATSRALASEAFAEIDDRARSIGEAVPKRSGYPFKLSDGRDVVSLRYQPRGRSSAGLLYLFLLVVTRTSMHSATRRLAGLDPTSVFETLCGDVLESFWGGGRGRTGRYQVGTARTESGRRSFRKEVELLCERLGEGRGWKPDARSPGAGDGGVDQVVWTRFQDSREGGLVGFAQCKTGVGWRDDLGQQKQRAFNRRYFRQPLLVEPVGIYMVPCRVLESRWVDDATLLGGILFDRCRIAQFGGALSEDVSQHARTWLEAALVRQVAENETSPRMTKRVRKR